MGSIEETPEEAKNDTSRLIGGGLDAYKRDSEPTVKHANNQDDGDESYENDFEPFETSKKDFYQLDSIESKT